MVTSSRVALRVELCASLLLATACQAFEPTIPQRRGQDLAPVERVHVALAEDQPQHLSSEPRALADAIPAAAPPAPYVAPRIGGDEKLQVEFRGANLSQVVHFIADRAGVNVYLDPGIDRQVDVSFPSISLDDALQAVLARNGMQLIEEPASVYWIELHDGTELGSASFVVQSIKAGEIEANLKALMGLDTKLVVDSSQNLVVVRGAQSDIDTVRDYLARADRLRRQVLIEARVLEVSLGDRFELGLQATIARDYADDMLTLMQDLSTPDDSFTFQFESENGDVSETLNAISRLAGTDLLSSPRVLALTGTEASIEVIQEVPYIKVTSTTSSTTQGTGSSVVQEVEFKESGVKLKVTPTIQEGGAVHVHIDQELSEVVDTFNGIPVLDKRTLVADFLVRDRETVVLGGLMSDRRSEVDKGVPGLMDLPLVGRLFRSDVDSQQKRELLIFLTPRVIDPVEGAKLTEAFKSSYSERVRETGVRSHAAAKSEQR